MSMVLVFGGTTEGKMAMAALAAADLPFWYSTKTAIDVDLPAGGQYRYGAFSTAALLAFCETQAITLIIHASHPFAAELHTTIGEVSERMGIPVVRPERAYPETSTHPLIRYADSYSEVLEALLRHNYEPVLSLTGVQTIARWKPYWQQKKMFCRILPRDTSLAIAQADSFPEDQLLLSFPGKTVEEELAVILQTGAEAVVTKESGESGFLPVKQSAAIAAGKPLYIIRRPALPAHFIKVEGAEGLRQYLHQHKMKAL
ncbi:precorrin-6A/cobalt-precorrin-6A reductase [Chitinophaga varians]|uniref:precorrin-6A/cobalt-precorrin-6A reductase n=1 Tax=Chitinophaga varians TaxID=2202339 RepID=UPI00165FEFC5|nr:precorrin-6A/cobalt-precorrin-6A reductase [Chitinophaga varians]MBC9908979.1 precorrin-6A/cobalt-precorrin-6A reductase [Chitinophaga varians]